MWSGGALAGRRGVGRLAGHQDRVESDLAMVMVARPLNLVDEKIADAAQVHRYTGVTPTVALHIPWDSVDSYAGLAAAASDAGIRLGTINANVFQDNDYKLGSVTNPHPTVRRNALDHLFECVDVMAPTAPPPPHLRPS